MKLARIAIHGRVSYAQVEDAVCRLIDGDILGRWSVTDETMPLADARLLAPVEPRQLVAIGLNYRAHAEESGMAIPDHPLIFIKTPNCVVGSGEPIVLPKMAPDEVDYECELVIVIGKEAKNVSVADAPGYVLGYTCGNDVSARDCQLKQDKQWARGKSFDTFAPLGPWIETDLDADNVAIKLSVNGDVRQESDTSDLIFPCMELVSYVSQCMTLYPGSVIMTGTPSGIAFAMDPAPFLREGDTVTVEIDGIGALTNPVEKE
ncbi:MAG: fumarylacetoacetate hydrolase family protein [Planctomycetota bacterium]|jgi:2-keto-4-pentenoate hydratase/2-oxohepta-3-ene-1,7-dioic acid hydratase in catechol pathway